MAVTAPRWLITVPTWGPRYVEAFTTYGFPSIQSALKRSGSKARFLIHTDSQNVLAGHLADYDVIFRPIPKGRSPHDVLGDAHLAAIDLADQGEALAFMCSDMVMSVEAFLVAEKRFAEGKRMIMNAASRTYGAIPPVGAASRDLLRWTMEHRHPITEQCFWGGSSSVPWALYFQRGDNIVLHGFHLHPFACIKDRPLSFKGTTADFDLAACYERKEIHVVTDADEMSMCEVSPLSRMFPKRPLPTTVEDVGVWAFHHAIDIHRWFFREHGIVIAGGDDAGEKPIIEAIIADACKRGYAIRRPRR